MNEILYGLLWAAGAQAVFDDSTRQNYVSVRTVLTHPAMDVVRGAGEGLGMEPLDIYECFFNETWTQLRRSREAASHA